MKRNRWPYFEKDEGVPAPLVCRISRRASFREVDIMGVVWHGWYASFFEECSTELRRRCGLPYELFFSERVQVPIVKLHVDYLRSLLLDEVFTIQASLLWSDAARLNIEYIVTKEDGEIAATGYTVQLFVDALSGKTCFVLPSLFQECRRRWQAGEFKDLR